MVYTFACTIGTFIDEDWEIVERVIDFKVLDEDEHKGLYAGKAFADSASGVGGFNRISPVLAINNCQTNFYPHASSITTDNASANDVLVATVARCLLMRYGIPPSDNFHIRCLAHVVNLIVQAILSALGEADNPDACDYYELNKKNTDAVHLDADADPDQVELDTETFEKGGEGTEAVEELTPEELEKIAAMKSPLKKVSFFYYISSISSVQKLRYIITKIVASPQRCARFQRYAMKHYLDRRQFLSVIRDVATRWN